MSLRDFGDQHAGRYFVTVAAAVGIAVLVLAPTTAGWTVFAAVPAALGTALLVMAVLGSAERLWRGDKVTQAQAPGGRTGRAKAAASESSGRYVKFKRENASWHKRIERRVERLGRVARRDRGA